MNIYWVSKKNYLDETKLQEEEEYSSGQVLIGKSQDV